MLPVRIVAVYLAWQGINTAEFDTAEFEVVKSRLTLQKERKEQREQEEKAAAQKALAEAAAARKAAQLAARKAVHEAAKDQMKVQRELHKAEAQASLVRCRDLFGVLCTVCDVRVTYVNVTASVVAVSSALTRRTRS